VSGFCVCLYSCLSWIASDPRHWCPVGVPQVVAVKQSRRTQSWRVISECRVIHSCPQDGRSHGSRHEHGLQAPRRTRFTGARVAHGHGVVQECQNATSRFVVSEKRCPRLAEVVSTIFLFKMCASAGASFCFETFTFPSENCHSGPGQKRRFRGGCVHILHLLDLMFNFLLIIVNMKC
jgi:hypothetical protein